MPVDTFFPSRSTSTGIPTLTDMSCMARVLPLQVVGNNEILVRIVRIGGLRFRLGIENGVGVDGANFVRSLFGHESEKPAVTRHQQIAAHDSLARVVLHGDAMNLSAIGK